MTVSPPAGTTGTPGGGSGAVATSDEVFGTSLIRLNPVDGLFLRAEHLDSIQIYARALGTAVGRAGGTGVAYGCTTTLSGNRLQVGAGLAIASSGQPLLLDIPASVPLPSPSTSAAAYLVVELLPGTVPTGDQEQVFGLLCDDPCGGGQQFRPYLVEGIKIRFRAPDLAPRWSGEQFRSAVASAYFETERQSMASLLPTSERDPARHGQLEAATWSTGTGLPDAEGVPIGLLVRDGSNWVLDVWAARRDRIETPPERGWGQRTGRRPRDVFLAQVLQFQAQLRELHIPDVVRSSGGSPPALPQHLVELPPAGYLPVNPASVLSVNDQVAQLLGPEVDLRFCSARPDEVGLALERAQHLDRIPLSSRATAKPKMDVIVPDGVPSTRSAASSVRFAASTITVGPKDEGTVYIGLARLRHAPGTDVTLAFAGASEADGQVDGLWFDLQLARSPFEMPPDSTAIAQVTVIVATERIKLDGHLQCFRMQRDTGTGLPTFEGQFSGSLAVSSGSQRPMPVSVSLRLSLRREGSTFVLQVALSRQVTATFEVRVKVSETGAWQVTFDTDPSLPDRPGAGVSGELVELPAAYVPATQARWEAERGVLALAETEVPLLAVNLLFAGAGPAGAEVAYSTPHDWVFFTRRHLLDCAPILGPDSTTIRLDLYVEVAVADEIESEALATPLYVAQLSWSRDLLQLSRESEAVLEAWRSFHRDFQLTEVKIWLGNLQVPAENLANPVTQRMGGIVRPVASQSGEPPVPLTPGSAGALIVTVEFPQVLLSDGGKGSGDESG